MDFLIDIGNSRIKWACADAGHLIQQSHAAPRPTNFRELADSQWGMMPNRPARVVVSSVSDLKFLDEVTTWIEQTWAISPWVIESPAAGWGIKNAYSEPQRLGCDRWAALVAVAKIARRAPVCVVDCGSAITIDLVNKDGVHQGGLIIPGIEMMRNALVANTARIRFDEVALNGGDSLLARDTASAVAGGSLYAAIAVIDRVLGDIALEMNGALRRVITGGDAPTLLPLLAPRFEHRPNLVLEGLALMAAEEP